MYSLLFDRIRNLLTAKEVAWEEKNMMGGITFMVDNKMCFGTLKGGLLCRIDPEEIEALLQRNDTEVMTQGGREMKGYVYVLPKGFESDQALDFWISRCLVFNPKAKASKRKK
ncbi:MAG: TfoX/Sxy family protein [Bacteroidota bacterium]